jgi:hypothetical protein
MTDSSKPSPLQKTDVTILRASLFLGAFSLLESSIVKAVEFFYHVTEPSGEPWKKYIQEVLIFSDDTLESCCVWLERKNVIKPEQFSSLMKFKERHEVIRRDFGVLVMQEISRGAKTSEDERFVIEKCDFEEMTDLSHRIEVWRSAVDYGLKYTGEEEDLEEIFPVSVIGMMRLTALAFPESSPKNTKQE